MREVPDTMDRNVPRHLKLIKILGCAISKENPTSITNFMGIITNEKLNFLWGRHEPVKSIFTPDLWLREIFRHIMFERHQ